MKVNPSLSSPASSLGTLSVQEAGNQDKSVFRQMIEDAQNRMRQADTQVRASLLGEAEIHEAMLALEHADLSLRLLVQVRNKLVQAYEELSRMSM